MSEARVAPPSPPPGDYDPRLCILHADMDAFFAAVEVLDDPTLRGVPLIIGHPGARGVVSTASYEARRFGVHSAMPSVEAMRRCPHAVWRAPRVSRYAELSAQIRSIFHRYTPLVEPLSLDEAFLDVAGSLRLFGGAIAIAQGLQQTIAHDTGGLTVSVGVATNKFLAKLASDMQKPAGLTVIDPDRAAEQIAPLPVRRLWGVGEKSAARLHEIGVRTIGEVARVGESYLRRSLGEAAGRHLFALAHGRDSRTVDTEHEAKSISTESTFAVDLHDAGEIRNFLFEAADTVAEALRKARLLARTVQLKVRTGSFRTLTRAHTLPQPTNLPQILHQAALELLESRVDLAGEGVRLLGLGAKGLIEDECAVQADLFASEAAELDRKTAQVSDRVKAALGRDAITRARLMRRHAPGEGAASENRPGRDDPGRVRRRDLGHEAP
ncbi:MAG: DNA polymerase IV [Planctomycetota bacterium]